ncbi:fatty acid desaturase 4 chloroplastic, partial [Phtheirospermum japonicum]
MAGAHFRRAFGYLLADLASGIYHWAVDNYGSAQTPVFGSRSSRSGPPPAPLRDHQVRDRRDRLHPGGDHHRRRHSSQPVIRRPVLLGFVAVFRRLQHVQRQVPRRGRICRGSGCRRWWRPLQAPG